MITKEQADHIRVLAQDLAVSASGQGAEHFAFITGVGDDADFKAAFRETRAAALKLDEALVAITEKP